MRTVLLVLTLTACAPRSAPQAERRLPIAVELRGPEGDAAPGARVRAFVDGVGRADVLAEGRADVEGHLVLELPTDAWAGLSRVELYAHRTGRGAGLAAVCVQDLAAGGPCAVELLPVRLAEVRVDPPEPGVEVQLTRLAGRGADLRLPPGRPGLPAATTDAAGRARFELPDGARFQAAALGPTGWVTGPCVYLPEPCVVAWLGAAEERTGTLELVLQAEEPAAAAGRTVVVRPQRGSRFAGMYGRRVVTDASGRATLERYPAGGVWIELLVLPGEPPWMPDPARSNLEPYITGYYETARAREMKACFRGACGWVRAGETSELRTPLVPAARRPGTVRGPGGVEPVAGARLEIRHVGSLEVVTTDERGGFEFLHPLDDRDGAMPTLDVVEAPPRWRGDETRRAHDAPRRRLPSRDAPSWDVVIPLARALHGRAMDEAGRPVPRAWVQVLWPQGRWAGVTNEAGRFELPDVEADVVTACGGAGELLAASEEHDVEGRELVLVLRELPRAEVSVRAMDPSGAPLAGVDVRVSGGGVVLGRGATGPDGAARLEFLQPDGALSVALGGVRALREVVALAPGTDELECTLLPFGPVRGRVVDSDGRPVPGAVVRHAGYDLRQDLSDADGRFELERVDRHRALLTARAAGFRAGGAVAAPSADEVELVLVREGEPHVPAEGFGEDLPLEERRALARRLLERWSASLDEARGGPTRAIELEQSLRSEQQRALEVLGRWRRERITASNVRPETPLPDDAAALRAALEGNPRPSAFELLARWIERGGWDRERLLEMFEAGIRAELADLDLPRAISLAPLVAERDPALARELLWRLLDRVPPAPTAGSGRSRVSSEAPLALSVALSDPGLGRRLFARDRPLLEQLLEPGVRISSSGWFATVRWIRLYEPELFALIAQPGADDPARARLARAAAELLLLERAELEARLVEWARRR